MAKGSAARAPEASSPPTAARPKRTRDMVGTFPGGGGGGSQAGSVFLYRGRFRRLRQGGSGGRAGAPVRAGGSLAAHALDAHLQAVQACARRDEQRLAVLAAEADVRRPRLGHRDLLHLLAGLVK